LIKIYIQKCSVWSDHHLAIDVLLDQKETDECPVWSNTKHLFINATVDQKQTSLQICSAWSKEPSKEASSHIWSCWLNNMFMNAMFDQQQHLFIKNIFWFKTTSIYKRSCWSQGKINHKCSFWKACIYDFIFWSQNHLVINTNFYQKQHQFIHT
jgi:hypothetical protein